MQYSFSTRARESVPRASSDGGGRAPAAAMLKQEELASIKAVSSLQVTPALLRELRSALFARKRRTVVPAGFRGRAPGGDHR